MNRLELLNEMDALLEMCKPCPNKGESNVNPDKRCGGCETYTKLREIGNQLEGKPVTMPSKIQMTVDEFVKLKYMDNLPMTKIAEMKGVKDPTIHHWAKKRKEEIEKALQAFNLPDTSEVKQKECTCKAIELKAKIQALEFDFKDAKERKERYLSQLLDAKDKLVKQDYLIHNQADALANTRKTLEQLTKENEHLKGLVKLYI